MARTATNPHERYRQAHWGVAPDREYEVHDLDLPAHLVEMGKLRGVEVRVGASQRSSAFSIDFQQADGDHDPILAFSPKVDQKLYIVMQHDRDMLDWSRTHLWQRDGAVPTYDLNEIQDMIGGRQKRYPLPRLRVQAIGRLAAVIYATEKRGDGPSKYRHKMGEDGGIEPMLCVSEDGRLWIAGGTYTVPNPGITR